MQSIEAYKKLLLKINKNDTNSNIDISKGEFVLLFNEQKDIWLRTRIKASQNNSEILDLSELSVKHKILNPLKEVENTSVFELPDNFFEYISSYSYCSNSQCNNVLVRHFLMKPKNENTLLENVNCSPSLDFEETVVDLSNNRLYVFFDNFNVDKSYLNYYKKIGEIDIEGYRKLNNEPSKNIDPDISDELVHEILDLCAVEIIRRYENPNGFQLAKDRIISQN